MKSKRGGWGSPMWPAEDHWYPSRGRRAEQSGCLLQPRDDSKYLQMETLTWIMSANGLCKDFVILGSTRSTAFQNYWNHLSRTLGTCSTLRTLSWYRVTVPIPGYWGSWEGACSFSTCLPTSPRDRRRKKIWKQWSQPLSLTFDSSQADQLCKNNNNYIN